MQTHILHELTWRGLLAQRTHQDELDQLLASPGVRLYCGFDPSNSSLTIGNLVPLMCLVFFWRHGHRPIALVGGATGRIGDPGGKSAERNLLSDEQIQYNLSCIQRQIEQIIDRARTLHPETLPPGGGAHPIDMANNADWMAPWSFLDFLRDVGKLFRVNTMLTKDSVRSRLENREQGISYTEFSYMLIQAYDFFHLFEKEGCVLQVGGNDQWGNITAGTDLIHKKTGQTAYGVTFPLLTTASGEKIGKSEKGAVWLDPERTSPYEFYQYWVQRQDADVIQLLKTFTFLSQEDLAAMQAELDAGKNKGQLQQRLAQEVTDLIHGPEETQKAIRASRMLFGEAIQDVNDALLNQIFADVPSTSLERQRLFAGLDLIDLLVEAQLCASKGEARRLIKQGGAYVNNNRQDDNTTLNEAHLASESMLVLRSGKKTYHVVRFH